MNEQAFLAFSWLCLLCFQPAFSFVSTSTSSWVLAPSTSAATTSSRGSVEQLPRRPALFATTPSTAALTTLTDETTWNFRIVLRGAATERGKKVDEIFTLSAHFVEEEGYEPPQGMLRQLPKPNDRLQITSSRWVLSEDPNDRKDGLWVWGLFKEPLYPFLLLQMETARVPLPGKGEGDDGVTDDAIVPLKLYAQIRHKREKDVGVVLQGGQLNVRVVERVKADPFGAAQVDLYDNLEVGTISIQPAGT